MDAHSWLPRSRKKFSGYLIWVQDEPHDHDQHSAAAAPCSGRGGQNQQSSATIQDAAGHQEPCRISGTSAGHAACHAAAHKRPMLKAATSARLRPHAARSNAKPETARGLVCVTATSLKPSASRSKKEPTAEAGPDTCLSCCNYKEKIMNGGGYRQNVHR
jgi:hypothetical protein